MPAGLGLEESSLSGVRRWGTSNAAYRWESIIRQGDHSAISRSFQRWDR